MTITAHALLEPWQVVYEGGEQSGVSDTHKYGLGGGAGLRPHDLLEAALASCMTITARMQLHDLAADTSGVAVQVEVERDEAFTRFHYTLTLAPELEEHRAAIMSRLEQSPVRKTLSKPLGFVPAQ